MVRDDDVELARRVSTLLGRDVRLITTADVVMPDDLAAAEHVLEVPVGMAAPGTMLDLAALHIVTAATLHRVAAEYPGGDWNPRRMRPNMIIDAGPETPVEEDEWFAATCSWATTPSSTSWARRPAA